MERTTDELLAEYAASRDPAVRDRIVDRYLSYAALIARRFSGRGAEYDDLYQTASLALTHAIERYESGHGAAFTTYATPVMVGAVRNYLRDRTHTVKMPRTLREDLTRMNAARERFFPEYGREPTVPELAAVTGLDEERVLELLEAQSRAGQVSLDAMEEDASAAGLLPGGDDPAYARFEDREALRYAIAGLKPNERELIRLRYREGRSQRETAAEMRVSQMTVSRLERTVLQKMRALLEDREENRD